VEHPLLQVLACCQLQPWVACLPSSAAVLLPGALPAAAAAAAAMTQQQQRHLLHLLLKRRLQHGQQLLPLQLALLLQLLPAQLLLQLPAHARGWSKSHMGLAWQQPQQPQLQQQLLRLQQQLHLLRLHHCVIA
jgi:hypothetical protein